MNLIKPKSLVSALKRATMMRRINIQQFTKAKYL